MSEFICACCTTPTRIENRRTYRGDDVCAWCLADHLAVDGEEATDG